MKSVGSLSNGQEVKDIKLDDNEVEIYGNKDDLDDIDEITARINLDGISDTTEEKVDFQVPDKVTKVSPKDTTAKITVK